MVQIELHPTLNHCIETTARKEYHRLAREYLDGRGTPDFEERADLPRAFLESTDFRKLRQQGEAELLQGRRVEFILSGVKGHISYRMVVAY